MKKSIISQLTVALLIAGASVLTAFGQTQADKAAVTVESAEGKDLSIGEARKLAANLLKDKDVQALLDDAADKGYKGPPAMHARALAASTAKKKPVLSADSVMGMKFLDKKRNVVGEIAVFDLDSITPNTAGLLFVLTNPKTKKQEIFTVLGDFDNQVVLEVVPATGTQKALVRVSPKGSSYWKCVWEKTKKCCSQKWKEQACGKPQLTSKFIKCCAKKCLSCFLKAGWSCWWA